MDSPSQSEFPPSTYATNNCGCGALFSHKLLFVYLIGVSPASPIVSVFRRRRKKCKWCMKEKFQRGTSRRAWYSANTCAITALSLSKLCGRNFLIFFLGLQVRFGPGNMLHLSRLSDSQNRIWIIWIGWKTLKHPTLLDNTRSLFASDMGCNQKAPLGTKRTKGTTEKIYSQPDTAAVYTNRI